MSKPTSRLRTDVPPPIAVVVATHNRAALLPRLVAGLEAQRDVAGFEVVIVDDGSTDDTRRVLHHLCARSPIDIRIEHLERNAGPATARNRGWRVTTAPVVAFTDDDCVPTPSWLARLIQSARDCDVVQGRTLPDPLQWDALGPFSRTLDIGNEDGYYQTCNIAYRRELLEQLDGFYEQFRFPAGEDTDLAWRAKDAGATTTFEAEAIVYHDIRRSSFLVAIRDSWRWQSAALAVSRHPELREVFVSKYVWRASHRLAIGAMIGGAAVALAPRSRLAWLAGAALAAPYARYRTVTAPLPGTGPRRRWLMLPGALAVDSAEVVACLVGSARHRTLVI
jgi:glycosyltransferase involved in cell wall biosynthesis